MIVFLDLDGVVNVGGSIQVGRVDPRLARNLNPLSDAGASFVVTSSWRYLRSEDFIRDALTSAGFYGRIAGSTGWGRGTGSRGDQIRAWLASRQTQWVVLDDKDVDVDRGRMVRVDPASGVSPADVERAILIMEDEPAGGRSCFENR